MKTILSALLLISLNSFSQYLGVKAKYTQTRLVENPGHSDTRENRLILAFYHVSPEGIWSSASLINHDIYIREDAVQVAGIGGVLDSLGSNYPGYTFTAPVVAAYFNSKGREYFECNTWDSRHYVVNGHEVDCGFVRVSKWVTNYLGEEVEEFSTIEVGLAFYAWPHPWWTEPGNLNFGPIGYVPNPPYNHYSYFCEGFNEYVMRGAMLPDSIQNLSPLPVHFDRVRAMLDNNCRLTLNWSNLTETDIRWYIVERTTSTDNFLAVDTILPYHNNGDSADYSWLADLPVPERQLFRIRAVEFSGNSILSSVIRVNGCNRSNAMKSTLQLYPNPAARGHFTMSVTDLPAGKYHISLINSLGILVNQMLYTHPGGFFSQPINIDKVNAGIYSVLLRSDNISLSQQLFITQ